MKIPTAIRIGGVEYIVADADTLNNGVNLLNGHITYGTSTIQLNANQTHQHKCIALWHEIVHAMIYHACLELDDGTEEKIAEVLGFSLYQVLQDNGKRLFDLCDCGEEDGT